MMVGQDIMSDSPAIIYFNDRSFITDKCFYDANYDSVTPIGNAIVTDDYIENVQYIVKNKFNMAQSIVDYNYYRVIDEAVYGNGVNEHNVPKEEAGGSHSGAGDSDSDGTGRDDRSSDNDSSDASHDIGTGGDAR